MTLTSTLMSNGEVVATWVNNQEIVEYFKDQAPAFYCVEDSVELLITQDTVNTLVHEIEAFLEGLLVDESSALLAESLTHAQYTYRETLV